MLHFVRNMWFVTLHVCFNYIHTCYRSPCLIDSGHSIYFPELNKIIKRVQNTDSSIMWGLRIPSKTSVVLLSKKLYANCFVLVVSRNWFERKLNNQKPTLSWKKHTNEISVIYSFTLKTIVDIIIALWSGDLGISST